MFVASAVERPLRGVDQLVQQARRLRRFRPLQPVEAELVDHQQVELARSTEPTRQRPVGQGRGELLQHRGAGRRTARDSPGRRPLADRLDEWLFPRPLWPTRIRFSRRPTKSHVGQLLDPHPVDHRRVERPVEVLQRPLLAEPRPRGCGGRPPARGGRRPAPTSAAGIPGATAPRSRRGRHAASSCSGDSGMPSAPKSSRICWRSSVAAGFVGDVRVASSSSRRLRFAEGLVVGGGPWRTAPRPARAAAAVVRRPALQGRPGPAPDREDPLHGRG